MDNDLKQNISNINQNLSNNKSRIMRLMPYIFCFFIFSFLGWVLETLFCGAQGNWEKRGFLYSTICPIYRNWSISFNFIFG
ncbi:MAG: putative ABC transporter permease [Clostridia bacterium]|nr:putative ABC transporter permease [Clostridia bacterium]